MKRLLLCGLLVNGCLLGSDAAAAAKPIARAPLKSRRLGRCNQVRVCIAADRGRKFCRHPDCALVPLADYLDGLVRAENELEERLPELIRAKDVPLCVDGWAYACRDCLAICETSGRGKELRVSLADSNISSLAAHKEGIKRVAHLDLQGCKKLEDLAECRDLEHLKRINLIGTGFLYLKVEWFSPSFLLEEIFVDDSLFIPIDWVVKESGSRLRVINMKNGTTLVRSGEKCGSC